MTTHTLPVALDTIANFCARWHIREFALFGSILRDDFRADSDVDVLIAFQPHTSWGIFAYLAMQEELETLFQRPVDLVSRSALEESSNWIRREHILAGTRVLFSTPEQKDDIHDA